MNESELYGTTMTPPAVPWRWKLLANAAMVGALALLSWVLATWGWRWFGPAPVTFPPPTAIMTDAASHIAAAHLFGVAHTPTPSEGVSGIGDLRLLGVFAQRDGEGFALFRSGSRGSMLVAAGHDVVVHRQPVHAPADL